MRVRPPSIRYGEGRIPHRRGRLYQPHIVGSLFGSLEPGLKARADAEKISMELGEKQKSHPDPQWKRSPWRGSAPGRGRIFLLYYYVVALFMLALWDPVFVSVFTLVRVLYAAARVADV